MGIYCCGWFRLALSNKQNPADLKSDSLKLKSTANNGVSIFGRVRPFLFLFSLLNMCESNQVNHHYWQVKGMKNMRESMESFFFLVQHRSKGSASGYFIPTWWDLGLQSNLSEMSVSASVSASVSHRHTRSYMTFQDRSGLGRTEQCIFRLVPRSRKLICATVLPTGHKRGRSVFLNSGRRRQFAPSAARESVEQRDKTEPKEFSATRAFISMA